MSSNIQLARTRCKAGVTAVFRNRFLCAAGTPTCLMGLQFIDKDFPDFPHHHLNGQTSHFPTAAGTFASSNRASTPNCCENHALASVLSGMSSMNLILAILASRRISPALALWSAASSAKRASTSAAWRERTNLGLVREVQQKISNERFVSHMLPVVENGGPWQIARAPSLDATLLYREDNIESYSYVPPLYLNAQNVAIQQNIYFHLELPWFFHTNR